jgi:hypothetical protein
MPNPKRLKQVGHIHGHLLNSGVVESLNLTKRPYVIVGHKVDS